MAEQDSRDVEADESLVLSERDRLVARMRKDGITDEMIAEICRDRGL